MKTRSQLIAEAQRIRAECIQILTDAEHWNTNVRKPFERPIDPDPKGDLAKMIGRIDTMLAAVFVN